MKTAEQRASEVKSILADIDAKKIADVNVPLDIKELYGKLEGYSIRELVPENWVIDKLEQVISKDGKKTFYNIFTTGFGLADVKKAGNRKLRLKLQLFLQ